MAANKAQFTINGTAAATKGFDAPRGQAITLNLEDVSGVLAVTYQTYDAADPSSPLASTGAPSLTFQGNGLNSFTPATPSTAATIVMLSTTLDGHSWIVRCTATLVDGTAHVFERMISLRTNKPRKYVPGEVTQYSSRGWGDSHSELLSSFNSFHNTTFSTNDGALTTTNHCPLLPRSCSIFVSAMFYAVQSAQPNNGIIWFVEAGFASSSSGIITVRLASAVVKKRDLSAGALAIATDPIVYLDGPMNQLAPRVQGLAGTVITWQCRWDIFQTSS